MTDMERKTFCAALSRYGAQRTADCKRRERVSRGGGGREER